MSHYKSHDYLFNRPPIYAMNNRDEKFLIDVIGNWIPESDIICYGLLNSNLDSKFYKLRKMYQINPKQLYYDTSFYTGEDLINYLNSENDIYIPLEDEALSADEINKYTEAALENYNYLPSNELMLRHAIIESLYQSFMVSITLVYPWPVREIDLKYLQNIIPSELLHKINVRTGNILDILKENASDPTNTPYTSIITNELSDVDELTKTPEEYGAQSSFIMLRNHSGNMKIEKYEKDGNTSYDFIEIGTREILERILDQSTGLPTSQIRFARYEPILFEAPNFGEFESPYLI